ncbi:putative ARC18-subunit of the Arp2/3 complex [Tilletiaria anomala UBC 951]|uniref:Actin-related protein 2/3 complex subunit 3 n=1 Tax=Tilletiaria anomala (strain ATCC 24038 / CBS 436.72 / UBC 951) TaxID=1037660 RepID=A0A066V8D0_TILAU|nr:putative ARC18-subunit of the Arp2/3 complex [Tilletiaria anomala UBC 951]KDN37992.1 putative ARC18-subunit of the Arp2/3 complex [Tilletiaria anomala UBC 951]
MPAYHSMYNQDPDARVYGSIALLPIRTRIRGPAPTPADPSAMDIIDESIDLFRANSLFRNFEIKGPADRALIYLILFISDCLTKIATARVPMSQNEAVKQLSTYAVDNFALPGDANFPLNQLYSAPRDRAEADALRSYLTQARQETAARLIEKIYINGKPSKFWLAFTKRKFMGKSLS